MSREWKPGDVALTTVGGATEKVSILTETYQSGRRWWRANGWVPPEMVDSARPLVVIDPEDREQIEQIAKRCYAELRAGNVLADRLQAALRALANPKPEEPGRYGVVLDTAGQEWCRIDVSGGGYDYQPLGQIARSGSEFYARWSDIAAVEIVTRGQAR